MTTREAGRQIGEALSLIDFSVSERNYDALVRLPSLLFAAYEADGSREYARGEVVRVGNNKFLMQNWGKIDPANPPRIEDGVVLPSLCKLFRDGGRYDWVREEWCIRGYERYYEDKSRPENTGWYRVVMSNAGDNNTAPPYTPLAVWERV